MTVPRRIAALLAALLLAVPAARAAVPAACRTVRMTDPGWTDITSTNAVLGVLLHALGYRQKIDTLSVPITFQALADGRLDVFQGNWMPAQTHFVESLLKAGKVEVVHPNLQHAKFTLAVPTYVADAGVQSFQDLAKYAAKFDNRIYGIEPGAPANQSIEKMIKAREFGLGRWQLIESSEQGMLSEVARAVARKQWIVFLAWEPHPMNTQFRLTYLSGGDKYFGPDFGSTTVNTIARKGFVSRMPEPRHAAAPGDVHGRHGKHDDERARLRPSQAGSRRQRLSQGAP